jgi:hypothetical protein
MIQGDLLALFGVRPVREALCFEAKAIFRTLV